MSTDATVVIKGRNELSYAVKEAEQQLRGLAKAGDLVGKLLRGGAIVGAVVAFERLAENAEKAADAIGDKGTAQALRQLNGEIDRLKQKGVGLIGQVLGSVYINYRGTEIQKLTQDITNLRGELERLVQSNGGSTAGLGPGYLDKAQKLAELEARLAKAKAQEETFTARRAAAMSRGGGSGVLTRYSSTFDDKPEKKVEDPFSISLDTLRSIEETEKRVADYYGEIEYRGGIAKDIAEQSADALDDITASMEAQYEAAANQNDEMTVFAEEAARNMQSSFANFLFDPFKDGLDGMLAGFIDTIRRMVAELFAQQILMSFFSWGSGLGGNVGKFFGAMAKGGARASGGPVIGGVPYKVGERGAETFVPATNGYILPAGAGGGMSFNWTINSSGDDSTLRAILPGLLKQTKDQAVAEIRNLNGRGRM